MGARQCPFCDAFIFLYLGHDCHHISPGTGCAGCHRHFCFACLGYKNDGNRWQGCPNCETDNPTCTPNCSDTCMCCICPECKPGSPCDLCGESGCPACNVPEDVAAAEVRWQYALANIDNNLILLAGYMMCKACVDFMILIMQCNIYSCILKSNVQFNIHTYKHTTIHSYKHTYDVHVKLTLIYNVFPEVICL